MSQTATLQPPRTYRSPKLLQRRANILDAARQLLAEQGYEGVTMNGLAAAAGVTKKTLYNTYGSKDELLLAAVGEVITSYRQPEVDQPPGIRAILQSRRRSVALVLDNPAYSRAMIIALTQAPNDHPLVELLLGQAVTFAHTHLAADAERLRANTDTESLALQIVAQAWGLILLLAKAVITEQQFEQQSLSGLAQLLDAASANPSGSEYATT